MELWTGALSWWKCHWPIWPDGISSWTPLKPQYSSPNPNPLANQLWYIDFLTPSTPLIIPHRLPAFLEFLMRLKNWCSIHARWRKSSLKHSIRFCDIFPSLNRISVSSTEKKKHRHAANEVMDSYRSWESQTWPIKWNAVAFKQQSYRYCYMDALFGS